MGPMNKNRERDEHLEQLWYMKEEGKDSVDALKSSMGAGYDANIIDQLLSDDLVELSEENDKIILTKKGGEQQQNRYLSFKSYILRQLRLNSRYPIIYDFAIPQRLLASARLAYDAFELFCAQAIYSYRLDDRDT